MSSTFKKWTTTPLENLLISLESGSRPRGGVRGIPNGIPSIGGEHLTYKGTFDFTSIKYVPKEFANNMNKGRIQKDDILIVKDGATTGKTAFVDEYFPFKDAVVNEHVFICRPSKFIEPKFLFRFLTSKEGQERILENFQGSAQGGINLSFAPNTEVPFPPFNEQRRIVAKLEKLLHKVDACKERLEKIPLILKRFRQSVLAAACSGRLTADWREKNPIIEPAIKLLASITERRRTAYETALRASSREGNRKPRKIFPDEPPSVESADVDLPETWTVTNVDFLAHVTKLAGFEYTKHITLLDQGDVPVVRAQNVQMGRFVPENLKYIMKDVSNFLDRSQLHGREILMVFIGAGTGNVCMAPKKGRWHLAPNVAKIDVDGANSHYLLLYLQSPIGFFYTTSWIKATAQPSLSMKTIRKIVVHLPPLEEQQEIVRRLKELFEKADEIEERYKKAKAFVDRLTQSILAKTFRGELVPQDPNDEPASVLLERIREEQSKIKTDIKIKTKRRIKK